MSEPLKAPFPWFGGKSRVAAEVWARFGDTPNYVEPFAGSLAVLLGRPEKHAAKTETVNDLDGFIANFWRAIAADPEATAFYADWPIIEADLNARHAYLVGERDSLLRRLEGDPEFYDARIAGWWVAGVCGWIGSGYCSGEGPWVVRDGELVNRKLPHLGDAGRGINRKLPHLGNAGRGINRQMPHLSNAGRGINRQMPHLSNAGQGINRQMPHLSNAGQGIIDTFTTLAARLRRVRICNGDWQRVVSESVTIRHGLTAVFLDPPYGDEVEQTRVYASDSGTVAADVRAWCIENGNNNLLRIALCGYEGEGHDALLDYGWTTHAWRTSGGYGGGRGGTGDANRHKERIYFSPACIAEEGGLFDLLDGGAA
jgi:DNA adenine methylase